MPKSVIRCPVCGSEEQHTYKVPGHPELTGKTIELMNLKYEGITIARLVTCARCGNIYDSVVAKRFKKAGKVQYKEGDPDAWLKDTS